MQSKLIPTLLLAIFTAFPLASARADDAPAVPPQAEVKKDFQDQIKKERADIKENRKEIRESRQKIRELRKQRRETRRQKKMEKHGGNAAPAQQ
ncbi:MAG: hypothetical protein AB7P04_07190 [Bacteriovoracia bacterium]